MKKTAYKWEYKVVINAIIANIVCLWKFQLRVQKLDTESSLWQEGQDYWMSSHV